MMYLIFVIINTSETRMEPVICLKCQGIVWRKVARRIEVENERIIAADDTFMLLGFIFRSI